ncbi:uncharacterized protein LOC125241887 [Leguminivora glycinivorella]|uniref:uncharacterized protein LOC125241887 n=1 Tax=Leguminivora glycinivorella TaxID=1035111 RepID=UPI00200CFC16|nr:uncharacterized protein LOC125241887 [Leguminivora glycinivorella]
MYVIHATVYQVGIITNKSDDEIANMTGNQEALSFYHSNGTAVDLSGIPAPLLTNVTAQSAVAVVPVQTSATSDTSPPLSILDQITKGKRSPIVKRSEYYLHPFRRETNEAEERGDNKRSIYLFRRSMDNSSSSPAIKVVKETSLIPPEVGLKSIGLPALIGLNTSIESVPLPIPNASVVRYAKISTLVKTP